MTKEAKALIELIENNIEKARKTNSFENAMELAYLIALVKINELNHSEQVSKYIAELFDIRIKEVIDILSKCLMEME